MSVYVCGITCPLPYTPGFIAAVFTCLWAAEDLAIPGHRSLLRTPRPKPRDLTCMTCPSSQRQQANPWIDPEP